MTSLFQDKISIGAECSCGGIDMQADTDASLMEIGRSMHWQVYILRCSDGSLYTGISTDVQRRFAQHAAGRGAKYFRGRSPRRIVYLESGHDRSSASRREMAIKKLCVSEKRALLLSAQNQITALTKAERL